MTAGDSARGASRAEPPMPIIVGVPRSGTTLLRFMLDAHPDLAIPPETGFLTLGRGLADGDDPRGRFLEAVTAHPPELPAWGDFGISKDDFAAALASLTPFSVDEGCRTFYRLYAARFGKRRWGDKTPNYGQYLPTIVDLLPEAHVVHIIRDGRDVALSLRQVWFSPGNEIETLAAYWAGLVQTARRDGAACRHYLEVRYDAVVLDTERTLRAICGFLDLDFDPRMLEYHRYTADRLTEHRGRARADGTVVISHATRLHQQALTMHPPQPSRVGAWKHEMSSEERQRFEAVAGDVLDTLGYERG